VGARRSVRRVVAWFSRAAGVTCPVRGTWLLRAGWTFAGQPGFYVGGLRIYQIKPVSLPLICLIIKIHILR
jgi:hypothetical protein